MDRGSEFTELQPLLYKYSSNLQESAMAAASRFVPMLECISSMQEFRVDTLRVKTLLSNVKELRGAIGETAACLEQVFLQVEMKVARPGTW